MSMISFGDLARTLVTKSQVAQLRSKSAQLTQELSTGLHADLGKRVSGDHTHLFAIERDRDLAQSFLSVANHASFRLGATQHTLDVLSDASQSVTADLRLSSQVETDHALGLASEKSRRALDTVVGALNQSVGGRSLFSGVEVNNPALKGAAELLSRLHAELAGATTADEVVSRTKAWFDDPSGFAAEIYLGGETEAEVSISQGIEVQTSITALDPAIKALLVGFATATAIDDSGLALTRTERARLASLAADLTKGGEDQVVGLAGHLGISQQRIESTRVSLEAQTLALDLARSEIVSVDPLGVATELEAVQTNLETLYAVTARISRLTLADFIR